MEKHVTLVAVLQIGFGAIGISFAILVFLILTGSGILSGNPEAMTILAIIGSAFAALLLVTSAPGILGGIALLKRWSWARVLMLIVAALELLDIPLGTMLGIYTLWVLLQDETVRLLSPQTRRP